MKLAVVTDSTAFLSEDALKNPNLFVIPIPVILDGKLYNEGIDIEADQAGLHFSSDADWFSHVTIFMDDLGGHMFGVKQTTEPYNQKSPDLRGLVQDVNAIGEHNRFGSDYATAVSPMFFSTKGYVSFFNTFAEGRYQFAMNGRTELYHAAREFN